MTFKHTSGSLSLETKARPSLELHLAPADMQVAACIWQISKQNKQRTKNRKRMCCELHLAHADMVGAAYTRHRSKQNKQTNKQKQKEDVLRAASGTCTPAGCSKHTASKQAK